MVNVLIVGATGYIGQAVAGSLTRSGEHRVFGLARNASKGDFLSTIEVIPIIGTIADNTELLKAIDKFQINIVVDVAGAFGESQDLLEHLKKVGAARLAAASKAGIRIPKLGFIYTSGIWVHGTTDIPLNDLSPVAALDAPAPPAAMVSWRPQLEQSILAASDVLDTLVIRPAMVYGRASAFWSFLFNPILEAAKVGGEAKSVTVAANPDSRPALIHVDDIASGIHAAVNKLPLLSGTGVYPIFDLVRSQESMRDILEAAARVFGFEGKVELGGAGDDVAAQAVSTGANVTAGRARQLLGWEAKKMGFVQGMEVYARAWEKAKK